MASIPPIKPPSFSQALQRAEKTVSSVQKGLQNQSISVRESLKQLKEAKASLTTNFKAAATASPKEKSKVEGILNNLTLIEKQTQGVSKSSQEKVGALILAFRNILGKRRKKREDSDIMQRRVVNKTLERGKKTENVADNGPQLY